jgi:hypothetical protein
MKWSALVVLAVACVSLLVLTAPYAAAVSNPP